MRERTILVLVGGISRNSLNKKLSQAFGELKPEGVSVSVFDISHLPFYSQDIEFDSPDIVVEFKDELRQADAVLFVTPEYNRSIPGVLKNAIDWGSRPYGQNLWNKKPAAIAGASIGNIGTFGAQHHLRQILSYLNLLTMNQPEFYMNGSKAFDETGKLVDETSRKFIKAFWRAFVDWIEFVIEDHGRDHISGKNVTTGDASPEDLLHH
jgi:chromate reductase